MERESDEVMTRKRKSEQTDDKEELNRKENYLHEKEVESENCRCELNEKHRRLEKKLIKQKKLTQKVADQIECPVCLEVPRSGPVPV